jgi:hypothetical protein
MVSEPEFNRETEQDKGEDRRGEFNKKLALFINSNLLKAN